MALSTLPAPRTPASLAARGAALMAALLLAACASKPPPARSARTPPAPRATMPPPPASTPVPEAATSAVPASAAEPPPAAAAAPPGDGPDPMPPPDPARVPDAEPAVEPIRESGPNKPYEVAGQAYVPITKDTPFVERGIASWYGRKFHGRRTASGEVYNMYAMTAAHKTLPIPSYARVRNPANGAEVVVRVNDRGPFVRGRIVDLSYIAAQKLGVRGIAPVELERITFDDIRTGAWRRASTVTASAPPEPAGTAPAAVVSAAAVAPVAVAAVPAPPAANASPPVQRAYTAPARGFWVQIGAFKERGGAEDFHRRVSSDHDWLAPMLALFVDLPLFRLQAGPYPSRDEAHGAAEQIRAALKLVPLVLERR